MFEASVRSPKSLLLYNNYLEKFLAWAHKDHKWHRIKFTCTSCWQEFLGIVKSRDEIVGCPYGCDVNDDEDFDEKYEPESEL